MVLGPNRSRSLCQTSAFEHSLSPSLSFIHPDALDYFFSLFLTRSASCCSSSPHLFFISTFSQSRLFVWYLFSIDCLFILLSLYRPSGRALFFFFLTGFSLHLCFWMLLIIRGMFPSSLFEIKRENRQLEPMTSARTATAQKIGRLLNHHLASQLH